MEVKSILVALILPLVRWCKPLSFFTKNEHTTARTVNRVRSAGHYLSFLILPEMVVENLHEAMMPKSTTTKNGRITVGSLALAITSGLFLTASFPRTDWNVLAWVALAPLFYAINGKHRGTAFKLGLTVGAVHYLTLLYWISDVMNTYGQLPPWVSWSILLLLVFYLSLYVGFFSALFTDLIQKLPRLVWTTPLLWVGLEYLRSIFLSGFPWENLGYAQYNLLPLIQISDIFGVYGLSALIVATNLVLFETWRLWRWKRVLPWKAIFIVGGVILACLFYGKWRLDFIDTAMETAQKRHIALIQGNIDQSQKWDPAFQQETLKRYERLTFRTRKSSPDLVIWPETALPFYLFHDREMTDKTLAVMRTFGGHFLVGSPSFSEENGSVRYYNSAYLLDPEGRLLGKYDKVHLVPYGEYVPLKKLFPFLGKIVQAVGDFSPGTKGRTLPMPGADIGVLICYEVIFPELARAMAVNGADVLVNLTNDAWFGRSSAPYQHLSMVVFRAVETRRAVARAANTGISAVVDPAGRILKETPLFEEAVCTQILPLMEEETVYVIFGHFFEKFCLGFLCLLAGWSLWVGRQRGKTT